MSSLPARALAPLLALLVLAPPAHAAPVFERLGATGARVLAVTSGASGTPVRAGEGATLLRVDEDAIAAFRAARGGRLSIPDATGGSVDLELEPLDILAPGASVTYTDGSGRHAFTADVSLYKGHVAGDPASWVVLSMGASGVLGLVERDGRRFTLSPTQRMSTHAPGGLGVHAFAPEGSLAEAASRFECGINADNERQYMPHVTGRDGLDRGLTTTPEAPQLNSPRFTFNVAVDCDFEIYSSKFAGDLNAATSYILTVLGTVNLIYERDLEATLKFPFVNLWTTAADPYSATTTQAELTEFQNYWNANMGGVSRNVAHLISGRPLGGGIAFIDGLCTGPGYGLSAIDCAYTYPTATTTWDVEVIAHELGHNFGSYHTHSCSWAAQGFLPAHTLIDSCQASEGSCATYTNHLPPDKGTIMSYCHLIAGVANGIRLDFHPVCVSRMRSVMSGCGALASLAPPRNPIATPISTGVHLSWTAGGSSGVLRYSVLSSRLPLDLNPRYVGNTPLTQFDTPGLGTYYYRVRAVRSADSSATSAEIKATVCSFVTGAPVTVGSLPTGAVSADLNGDGIQDVVLVTTGDGNLVTLLGQGAGGVGNGSFAAPVSVATGSSPACLALLDVNADGILDAIVGAQGDNTLQLHLGQGGGGVGDGTFGPATPLDTLAFAPTAIVTADFDEDGILDLAVAGGGTTLAMIRGLGTAGVPDGTFAAPVTVNAGSQARGLVAYDWNGDGITDLAVSGGGVRMLFGNGTGGKGDGTFTLGPSYNAGASPNQMALADWNADGIADLAVCNNGASSVSVLLGQGSPGAPDGTFAPTLTVTTSSGPNAVTVGDWDHNGIPDMVVVNNNASNVSTVLLGNGDGTFEPGQTYAAGGSSPTSLAVNDYNEDGTPDLLVCNRLSQTVTRLQAGCPAVLSSALAVVAPNGGETWVGDTEHTLTWTKGAGVMTVDLQRSDDGGSHWRTLARGLPGTSYAYTVTAPWTTTARIRVVDSHAAQFADASDADFTVQEPIQVGVGDDHPVLALLGAWPNPARRDLSVSLSLPAGDARGALELIDLLGRRVAFRDLAGLPAGRHQLTLLERRSLTPGVYLVRLSLGGEVRSLKVAVLH
ncbi:MAG TPA: FG-GAP-like repeat-containing protein [Candidatus Eisenbacteria bacterium]|jgi:hypothetical protein